MKLPSLVTYVERPEVTESGSANEKKTFSVDIKNRFEHLADLS